MAWQSALAIYFLFWMLCLFVVLPFMRRQGDEGVPVPGQADGAPARFSFGRLALWNTVVASTTFALFVLNYRYGWVTMEMLDITRWMGPPPR
jgi:predicted secreted protein